MKTIRLRIADAISRARREGLEPKSLYLTPTDLAELGGSRSVDQVDGLPIKRVSGKGRSRVFCDHGIARRLEPPPKPRRTSRRPPLTLGTATRKR